MLESHQAGCATLASDTWCKQDEFKVYMDDTQTLLDTSSPKDFENVFDECSSTWSNAFKAYFERSLKADIITFCGKWILTERRLYTPHSGITNNVSEGMNTVMKRLLEWKEVPVDAGVLSLHMLQNYYHNKILRGVCATGNFILRSEHQSIIQDSSEIDFPRDVCTPGQIIDRLKRKQKTPPSAITPLLDTSPSNAAQDTPPLDTAQDTPPSDVGQDSPPSDVVEDTPPSDNPRTSPTVPQTQLSLAHYVINKNRIEQVPGMKVFVIESLRGDKYCVSLFPEESCSCPAVATCYHIMAARLAIRLDIAPPKKTVSFSQLAKNSKKRVDKKSGRKKPRKQDYDIIPAPDSDMASNPKPAPDLDIHITSNPIPAPDLDTAADKAASPKKKLFRVEPPTCIDHAMDFLTNESVEGTTASTQQRKGLTDIDLHQLHSKEWLSDRHMNAAIALIKESHPEVVGLQDVLLQQRKSWKPTGEDYIQIFQVNNNHWLTTSTIGSDKDTIRIYDSMN